MRAFTARWIPLALIGFAGALFTTQLDVVHSFAQGRGSIGGSPRAAVSAVTTATDPGVRTGAAGAGAVIAGLSGGEMSYFLAAQTTFTSVEAISDGLGPRMNLDSCAGCHIQPAIGGSSPAVNPQVAFAAKDGGTDTVPSFLSTGGPIRETRFVRNADGSPDGGVHAIFTISGRSGAAGCSLMQPDYETALAQRNIIFRIPTPTFGAGLIEAIPDEAILDGLDNNSSARATLGIRGHANFQVSGRTISGQTNNNGNDGTVARFGWKAQNKSLLLFAGEAYNVEMGITNELFQTERDETSSCQFAVTPNDVTNMNAASGIEALSDIEKFAIFMRFLAPPEPSSTASGGAASIGNGRDLFNDVGCALCHTPSFTTGSNAVAALRNQPVHLFSDLLVHDMGSGLADGISQGQAGPQEFRSAPLWGLGQRVFLLHDGRTTDLVAAILAHQSAGSEANSVIGNFVQLAEGQKQDLLNFLRSL
jgi:CxxC motif-containing protein (DUF1111 family)